MIYVPNRLTPAERTLRARKAALTRWARADSTESSNAARRRIDERFEREAEALAGCELNPVERRIRAERLKKAHFAGLALKSAKARRAKRDAA